MAEETWAPDWETIAEQLVDRTLRVAAGERVVFLADPYVYPDLLEAVRSRVLGAGGIDHATILNWTPRLAELRAEDGQARDDNARRRERYARRDLLNTADVFIWLPNDFFREASYTVGESEWVLDRWRGRGVHFHWFPDAGHPPEHPMHREVQRIYQRAILELDYAALAERQRRLVAILRGTTVRVTTPTGTELSFELPADGWFYCNDGDASREKALRAVCARDREEELPCGAVRTIPSATSVQGIIRLRGVVPWNGSGFDIEGFASGLDLVFESGRIVDVRSGEKQAELDAIKSGFSGDWDRLGEVVLGTNPLLSTPPGANMPTYWGFGEGWLRLHLGDNVESGGSFASSLSINLFVGDSTVVADGAVIVRDGTLLVD